ncbi:MAG TPA: trigger factor [Verrucomicrobiae bacterium]|nr:trigger factor [Verrucomicrobiae bacterium]
MAVTVENTAPCRKTLRVEVDAARVAGTRAEIVQEFRKFANIPGFRPGKAPEPMVEKRYGGEIDEELRKRLIPESYREALAEQKLKVVGYPQVESVEYKHGRPLIYTAAVDTAPEFAVPEYKGIPLKKKPVATKEEDVTKTLESLREQQADFVAVEGRALRAGDFAIINYTGVADGKPIGELSPEAKSLGENKDFWLLISSESFLPGFCDQLVGAQAGEKRQVLVDFPADFPQKPLAGRKATFFVDLVAIKEKKLPDINDEFAKKLGLDSVEKLNESVRQTLLAEAEREQNADLRRQVVNHLLSKVVFELPDSLVQQETRSIIYDVVRENSLRGATKEQLEEKKNEIFGFASQSAQERLRTSFILDAIAQAEKLKVEEAEVEQRIAQLAQRARTTPERLKAQLTEKGGLEEIEEQILISKTLDFLVANAKIETASGA